MHVFACSVPWEGLPVYKAEPHFYKFLANMMMTGRLALGEVVSAALL